MCAQDGSDNYFENARRDIRNWEEQGPSWLAQVSNFILWPAEKAAELLIPNGVQEAVAKAIEAFLLGLSQVSEQTVDSATIRQQVAERIASLGDCPDQCRQFVAADREAQNRWEWHLGYAATEGATAGAVGLWGLVADIPAIMTLVIRVIQQIGTCYGHDVSRPEERDYILRILQTASAADVRAKLSALLALKQLETILIKVTWKRMAADLAAGEISRLSLLARIRQFAKSLGINLTKRKALQAVPVIGALVGASFNATFMNDVARTAYMSYRRRWIAEHAAAPPDDADQAPESP